MDLQKLHKKARKIRESNENGTPQPLGTTLSFGFGDPIGLATPGHIEALRKKRPTDLLPIFVQQSPRDHRRTGRSMQEALDIATVAVHELGWTEPWGADASNLQTRDDVRLAVEAGYSHFTMDLTPYVKSQAAELRGKDLVREFELLFETPNDRKTYMSRYAGATAEFSTGERFVITEEKARLAAVLYLRATAFLILHARYLQNLWKREDRFDLEVSLAFTGIPTSPEAHWIIASELDRAGVYFTSFAPCFTGRYEPGIDYQGSRSDLEDFITIHSEIARTLGPYKIGLNWGSEKFSMLPLLVRHAGELIHIKTFGASYLEALRVVSRADAELFRKIVDLSRQAAVNAAANARFSTDFSKIADCHQVTDSDLESVFLGYSESEARQMLYLGQAEVLSDRELGPNILTILERDMKYYHTMLCDHFIRYLSVLG